MESHKHGPTALLTEVPGVVSAQCAYLSVSPQALGPREWLDRRGPPKFTAGAFLPPPPPWKQTPSDQRRSTCTSDRDDINGEIQNQS